MHYVPMPMVLQFKFWKVVWRWKVALDNTQYFLSNETRFQLQKAQLDMFYNPPTIHCSLMVYFDHQKLQQSFRWIIWFFHMNWKILRTLVKVSYLVINYCSHMEKANEIPMTWNFKEQVWDIHCVQPCFQTNPIKTLKIKKTWKEQGSGKYNADPFLVIRLAI
jgi:hypothetical protein